MSAPSWLDELESALSEHDIAAVDSDERGEALIALAMAAGQEIPVPDDEVRGAVRRALFVLAAGGDPSRGLALDGRAVETMADDLDTPFRRKALLAGIEELRAQAGERRAIVEVLDALRDDDTLAWRAYSAARMVEAITEDQLSDS